MVTILVGKVAVETVSVNGMVDVSLGGGDREEMGSVSYCEGLGRGDTNDGDARGSVEEEDAVSEAQGTELEEVEPALVALTADADADADAV